MAYDTIGPYNSGVWLIAKQDGSSAALVDKSHLPPQGSGFQYYWLGATPQKANDRLFSDQGKLGVSLDINKDFSPQIQQAMQGKVVTLTQNSDSLINDLIGLGTITGIGAVIRGGGLALLGADAGEGLGGAKAGSSAAGGVAGGAGALKAAAGLAGGLSVASLFSNASLWAGVGMTLLGAFLVLFGIVKLSGADPKQLAKRMVP